MTEQEIKQKIKEISKEIEIKYKPEKIILFGSFAWGKPTENSDIDLFIVKKTDRSPLDRIRDVYRIIFGISGAIDVLVYTPEQLEKRKELSDPFILKIINEGKILYAR